MPEVKHCQLLYSVIICTYTFFEMYILLYDTNYSFHLLLSLNILSIYLFYLYKLQYAILYRFYLVKLTVILKVPVTSRT